MYHGHMTTNVKTAKIILGENLYQLKYYSEHTTGNISQGRGRDANIAGGKAQCHIFVLRPHPHAIFPIMHEYLMVL